jgi:4-methyl-5(b-hydroxyethyl)-thiazole monophosphate biosynthesis
MGQKRVVVFVADGFGEVEAMTPIDFLRRAGLDVTIAGVGGNRPTGAHGIRVEADVRSEDAAGPWDAVVLPGGMPGAENLAASSVVEQTCRTVMTEGGLVAAICAAPAVALNRFGLLDGRRFTCYPGFEDRVKDGMFSEDRVVVHDNLITSRGPGTAAEFTMELIRHLVGTAEADKWIGAGLFRI